MYGHWSWVPLDWERKFFLIVQKCLVTQLRWCSGHLLACPRHVRWCGTRNLESTRFAGAKVVHGPVIAFSKKGDGFHFPTRSIHDGLSARIVGDQTCAKDLVWLPEWVCPHARPLCLGPSTVLQLDVSIPCGSTPALRDATHNTRHFLQHPRILSTWKRRHEIDCSALSTDTTWPTVPRLSRIRYPALDESAIGRVPW